MPDLGTIPASAGWSSYGLDNSHSREQGETIGTISYASMSTNIQVDVLIDIRMPVFILLGPEQSNLSRLFYIQAHALRTSVTHSVPQRKAYVYIMWQVRMFFNMRVCRRQKSA